MMCRGTSQLRELTGGRWALLLSASCIFVFSDLPHASFFQPTHVCSNLLLPFAADHGRYHPLLLLDAPIL